MDLVGWFTVLLVLVSIVGYLTGVVWLYRVSFSGKGLGSFLVLFVATAWLFSPVVLYMENTLGSERPDERLGARAMFGTTLFLYSLVSSTTFDKLAELISAKGGRRLATLSRIILRGLVLAFAALTVAVAFGYLRGVANELGAATYDQSPRLFKRLLVDAHARANEQTSRAASCRQFLSILLSTTDTTLKVHSGVLNFDPTVDYPQTHSPRIAGRITYFHFSGGDPVPIDNKAVIWEPRSGERCSVQIGGVIDPIDDSYIPVPYLVARVREEIDSGEVEAKAETANPRSLRLFAIAGAYDLFREDGFAVTPKSAVAKKLEHIIGWLDPLLTLIVFSVLAELARSRKAE